MAAQLRPRIGDAIQWGAGVEIIDLVRKFMDAKSSRPEGIYGPLLIRLLAGLERYLRKLITYGVDARAAGAKSFEHLPMYLINRNVALTGRVLAAIDAPREHLTVDIDSLIANLASCKRGSESFRLNALAFSATVTGASPTVIEKALENIDVNAWWDGVGNHGQLSKLLGTKGARATGDRARERLKELWRWRNHLAHGGDEEPTISESQLREAIDFVMCFSTALDGEVRKRLVAT